jgi:FMNH2-dependent dimethyl sulfone monooxygenase
VKVGIMLPIGDTDGPSGAPSWGDIVEVARAAEDGGLDSAWLADHLLYRASDGREFGLHEAWTVLTGVAAVTDRIELGTLVVPTSFRNPVLTAKMAAALDMVSRGRLILGLGCGWHEPEYDAMGIPFDHRVGRFEEALGIISRLLAGERVTFEGRWYRADDAVLLPPASRRIPILIAAKGERMLRLTAEHADLWNTAWYGLPDDRLRTRMADFEAAMAASGRPQDAVTRTVGIDIRDPDQPAVPEPEDDAFAGSIDEIAELLASYERLGFGHMQVGLEPISVRSVERLAEAVRQFRNAGAQA